jgi:O-antigen/teichoic acid export membrane protein
MMGTLGLPNAVIRFLAGATDRSRLVSTAVAASACAGAAVGVAWVVVPGHLGFPLDDVAPAWGLVPLIVAVVALSSIGAVMEAAIIAHRQSKWVVVENGVASVVKLVALPLAVGLGAAGLFGLFAASLLASTLTSVVLLGRVLGRPGGRWVADVDVAELRRVRSFAAGNHLAALVSMLPGTVVRIVVLAALGSAAAGHLAMPLMIIGLLKFVPSTAAQSLFAEAAADEASLGRQARRALRAIYVVLIPGVLLLVVAAHPLLAVFGREYADAGATALQLLALSGVFAGFNYVADTVLNARRCMREYVFVNVVGSVCAIAGPVALVGHGLAGVGLGWLLGQAGYAVVAAGTLWWTLRRHASGVVG